MDYEVFIIRSGEMIRDNFFLYVAEALGYYESPQGPAVRIHSRIWFGENESDLEIQYSVDPGFLVSLRPASRPSLFRQGALRCCRVRAAAAGLRRAGRVPRACHAPLLGLAHPLRRRAGRGVARSR